MQKTSASYPFFRFFADMSLWTDALINDEIALIGESMKSHLIAWRIIDFDRTILGAKNVPAFVENIILQ